jgi:hypothetical protein
MAGDTAARRQDLEVREADAAAQVVDEVLARDACIEGEQVGLGQVGHVDVVPDTGSVGGWVIGAVNADWRAGC